MSISFAIAHKPGRECRVSEMCAVIRAGATADDALAIDETPGHPHKWSKAQWDAAIRNRREYSVLLDDDLILPPTFVADARKALAIGEIVSFTQHMPEAQSADNQGLRWVTSSGMLVGQGYGMPTKTLEDFLLWRANCVKHLVHDLHHPRFISCDGLINLYALCTNRRIWHTVPALVTHDNSLPSSFGNEGDWGRVCAVPWREHYDVRLPGQEDTNEAVHANVTYTPIVRGLLNVVKPEYWEKFGCFDKYYASGR